MVNEQQVIEFLESKDNEYIDNLIRSLNINNYSFDFIDSVSLCPYCGSISIKKNGKDINGNQRYYCYDCHKSFNDRTGTLMYYSHQTSGEWKKFIDYEFDKLTLKSEAYYLNLSVTTCFTMRHKLYKAVSELMNEQKLTEETQLDAMYLKINLKGTKPHNMPRFSKKRGGTSAFSGISHHKICVISAVDSKDNMIMRVTGLGSESFDKYKLNEKFFKSVDKIISDSKTSIKQFANHIKAKYDNIPTSPLFKRYLTDDGESLGAINELMTEVNDLITKTKGFGTKYLQGYLDFVIMRKQYGYKYDRKEIASKIYEAILPTKSFRFNQIIRTPMPISLKEAYYEYRYGIFA